MRLWREEEIKCAEEKWKKGWKQTSLRKMKLPNMERERESWEWIILVLKNFKLKFLNGGVEFLTKLKNWIKTVTEKNVIKKELGGSQIKVN